MLRQYTVVVLLVAAAACESSDGVTDPEPGSGPVVLAEVAGGLARPLFLTSPPGDSRLFVVEQRGTIQILSADGQSSGVPFLDLRGRVSTGGEQGLLGLAFHPNFKENGFFYVNYTGAGGTNIARYTATTPDLADVNSRMQVMRFFQPQVNHNGGWIGFGPDGMLHAEYASSPRFRPISDTVTLSFGEMRRSAALVTEYEGVITSSRYEISVY